LDCIERGYLGKISQLEQQAIEEMKIAMSSIEENCLEYYEEQHRVVGGEN
jgi:hypothetical protein